MQHSTIDPLALDDLAVKYLESKDLYARKMQTLARETEKLHDLQRQYDALLSTPMPTAQTGKQVDPMADVDAYLAQDPEQSPVTAEQVQSPSSYNLDALGRGVKAIHATPKGSYEGIITALARKYDIPENVFRAMIRKESNFNQGAVSPKGATGLGQLMPSTARQLGVDPSDPVQNLDGAARYFKQQLDRFKSIPLALSAYNAGPGNVRKYHGIPPFKETQNYVKQVMQSAGKYADGGLVGLCQKYEDGGLTDKAARLSRKAQYALSGLTGMGPEVEFATETPAKYFPKSEQHNKKGDAMRHMLFQAQLVQKYGETPAKMVGWVHENLTGPQGESEKAMDDYNDEIGREIGKVATSKDDMISRALQAIEQGKAQTLTEEQMNEGYAKGGPVKGYKDGGFKKGGKVDKTALVNALTKKQYA